MVTLSCGTKLSNSLEAGNVVSVQSTKGIVEVRLLLIDGSQSLALVDGIKLLFFSGLLAIDIKLVVSSTLVMSLHSCA